MPACRFRSASAARFTARCRVAKTSLSLRGFTERRYAARSNMSRHSQSWTNISQCRSILIRPGCGHGSPSRPVWRSISTSIRSTRSPRSVTSTFGANAPRRSASACCALKSALARLREFRDKEGLIDPRKTAEATQALAGRVRDELIRTDTELSTLKHYMRADAPSVKMLEARLASLQAQRRSVESEVTDTEKTRSEARSRLNADRQQVYIAGFVQPSLPEESLYPRRAQSVGIAFIICFAVWGIGG